MEVIDFQSYMSSPIEHLKYGTILESINSINLTIFCH